MRVHAKETVRSFARMDMKMNMGHLLEGSGAD